MFIAFEGLDGSGSSTQARLLAEYFQEKGKDVLQTKEPNEDSVIGKLIRDILQHRHKVSADSLQLLFSADRAEHIDSKIKPALDSGKVVITDRYFFSTIAFAALHGNEEWMFDVNKNFILPDYIFLFKLDPKECIKRIEKRGNEKELFEKEESLRSIWKGYEFVMKKFPTIHLIDASKSIEEISNEIIGIIGIGKEVFQKSDFIKTNLGISLTNQKTLKKLFKSGSNLNLHSNFVENRDNKKHNISSHYIWFSKKIKLNHKKECIGIINKWKICLVDYGMNVGTEINGIKPSLVFKNSNFKYGEDVLVIPFTSYGDCKNLDDFDVKIKANKKNGLKSDSLLKVRQIRCISKKRIRAHKKTGNILFLGELDVLELRDDIEKNVKAIFGLN